MFQRQEHHQFTTSQHQPVQTIHHHPSEQESSSTTTTSTTTQIYIQEENNPSQLITYNASTFCFMCRQNFNSRSDFMIHIRSHFGDAGSKMNMMMEVIEGGDDGEEGSGASHQDILTKTILDNSELCT
jgi:hypothetical protein